MFRVRRIHDDVLPANQSALHEAQSILRDRFPDVPSREWDSLGERLRNPFLKRFRTILFVAENGRARIMGCAVMLHEPEIGFCYLDWLAAGAKWDGRGVGAAIYEHIREASKSLAPLGLFFECLPDHPDRCADDQQRQMNGARLRFYSRYGARPIVNTGYEMPVPGGGSDSLPHLVWDDLDRGGELELESTRQVVRAILERKYSDLCPPEYVEAVVSSFRDDPVLLDESRLRRSKPVAASARQQPSERALMVVNHQHAIHHIRERGYVESPARVKAIEKELLAAELVEPVEMVEYPFDPILAVHDAELVDYLRNACAGVPEGKSVYPYVFPIRNATRPPLDLGLRAGYFCIDTFTPINRNAFPAAKAAVDCVLTATDGLLAGRRTAYALVRPPGHHAERRSFGGFCYFSNAAIGAQQLSRRGKVAILDIDYHHGNGQQDIFYDRNDVLTVSLHGDPSFAYPYFTGFEDEAGVGDGAGYNLNFPLPEQLDGPGYLVALEHAIKRIREFRPDYLVVALGLDPAKGDPTGTWSLGPKDFEANGRAIGRLDLPTLVVQEGGYRTRTLGASAKGFFRGLLGS